MSHPLCSAHGREHIHRLPLHHPRRHQRHLRPAPACGVVGNDPALNRQKAPHHSVGSAGPADRCLLAARLPVVFNSHCARMGGRVVDCARLESVCAAMHRGFESLPIRHIFGGMKSAAQRHRPTEGRPRRGGGRRPKSTFAVRAERSETAGAQRRQSLPIRHLTSG